MASGSRSTYIAYIDGIRAIAVLAVMFYHLEPSLIPGGFVGVDVFFVISGFVVTASLANHDSETLGQFLGRFYARRLSRLIPALVTMLVVTTLAYVLLVPKAWFNRAAESVGQAAFLGLSNWILDGQKVNYFEPRAELNPFTHTWSLGVEEQFYLIAPLLLFLALHKSSDKRYRLRAAIVIGLAALASLFASYYFGLTKGARFVFYLLVFRFWELAIGVLLFLLLPQVREILARFGIGERTTAITGVLLIAVAMFVPNSSAYPFLRASVAVAGALLLIGAAVKEPRDTVRKALASTTMVWIGLRSYALYLWHWPIYVLARWTVGLTVWPFNLAAIGLSFALAAFSYRIIEQPIRRNARLNGWPLSGRIGVFFALIATGWGVSHVLLEQQSQLGLGKVTREAADWYSSGQLLRNTLGSRRICEPTLRTVNDSAQVKRGEKFDPGPCAQQHLAHLFVIGDSHATAFSPMLEQLSAEEGRPVTVLQSPGCDFVGLQSALQEEEDPHCYKAAQSALEIVIERSKPGDIVFLPSLRLPRLISLGGQRRSPHVVDDSKLSSVFGRTEAEIAGIEKGTSDAFRWLNPLVEAKLNVIIEAPKPVFRAHPFSCIEWWHASNPDCVDGLVEDRIDIDRYRAPIMSALNTIAESHEYITIWDPLPFLCDPSTCSAMRNDRPLFFDADHLSPFGNLMLLEPFKAAIAL
jgi:peptidoglycan/LPS O-acetylase OafA/YrhL